MMDSYEPTRTIAYSNDLRWRMVYQRKVLKYNYAEISRNLGVDKSTVQRTVVLFDTTGAVDKKSLPQGKFIQKADTSSSITHSKPYYRKTFCLFK